MLKQAVSRANGEVWAVDWKEQRENRVAIVGEVRDVHVIGKRVGYCGSGGVGIVDLDSMTEVLRSDMKSAVRIRVLEAHYATLAVATATEVCILQKKWVALQSTSIFTSPITGLESHQHLLAVLSSQLTLISLSSLQPIYSLPLFPQSILTFTSESLAFLYSAENHQSISLCLPSITPNPVLTHSYGQASIAPFHLYWLLVLSLDCTLRMLNASLEVEFSMKIGLFGKIVGEIGAGIAFFVVTERGIEHFEACSEEEHIKFMLNNGYFDTAIEFIKAKREAFGTSDVLKLINSIHSKQGQREMQRFTQKLIAAGVIRREDLQKPTPPMLSLVPVPSPGLDQIPPQSPSPQNLFSSLETAITTLLSQRSARIFDLLTTSHTDISHFLRNLTPAQANILAEIDIDKAVGVVFRRWPEPDAVFPQLCSDLQYRYYLQRWSLGLESSAEAADTLMEEMIRRKDELAVDLLRSLHREKLEIALELASKYNHISAKVYLLSRLNRYFEVTFTLKSDLKAAISYLEIHWNEELWDFLLSSHYPCLPSATLPCLYMHPAAAVLVEQVQTSRVSYEEVKPLLRNIHSATEILRNANKIVEKERKRELKRVNRAYQRGFYVVAKQKCEICELSLGSICTFRYCNHHSHFPCTSDPVCPLCKDSSPIVTS